jgi:hypothetical protein
MYAYVLIIVFYGCLQENVDACVREPEYFLTLEACEARIEEIYQAKEMLKSPYSITFDYHCETDTEFAKNESFHEFHDLEKWYQREREKQESEEAKIKQKQKQDEIDEQNAIKARDPLREPWWELNGRKFKFKRP